MGEGLERRHGKIRTCVELIDAHPEACGYACLRVGRHLADLGTERLTWDDLWVILNAEINTDGSPLDRAVRPDDWVWTPPMMLLAAIFDTLQVANWQRGGGDDADRPEPLQRPGLADDDTARVVEGEETTVEEMDEWLSSRWVNQTQGR